MKKILSLFFAFLLLTGCGSKPAPTWIAAGHQQLETFKTDFLTGQPRIIAEAHFKRAIEEIKKGGDLDLLGRAWLTRMALEVAALEPMEEGEYRKIAAALPVPTNRHFHLFLTGNLAAVDGTLLHEQYRSLLKALQSGDDAEVERVLPKIDDPLSRLIAAGIAIRQDLENETILRTAVDTAAQNGWKRALVAWLKRLQTSYERAGDKPNADLVRQRLDLIGS
jgi:hypothetical protein